MDSHRVTDSGNRSKSFMNHEPASTSESHLEGQRAGISEHCPPIHTFLFSPPLLTPVSRTFLQPFQPSLLYPFSPSPPHFLNVHYLTESIFYPIYHCPPQLPNPITFQPSPRLFSLPPPVPPHTPPSLCQTSSLPLSLALLDSKAVYGVISSKA